MTRVGIKGLLARRTRAVLTALAIVLGVSMISGTFVLTDSIQRAFDSIFQTSYAHTDAVVSARSSTTTWNGSSPTVSPSVLGRVRRLPGVAVAAGELIDFNQQTPAQLLDRQGHVVNGSGKTFTFGVDPAYQRFNPLTLSSGHWASGPGQVVLDTHTAKQQGLRPGDDVKFSARGRVVSFRLVGTAIFGGVSSIGATFEIFDVPTAQHLLGVPGYTSISVAAKPGVTPLQVAGQIAPVLPPSAQVKTGAAQANAAAHHTASAIRIIRYVLLAFGGIALFVGAFVIFNTLSITVAQRTRELATLRTLGASRRQVLRSVLAEALAIGVAASAAGLVLGVAIARGLSWVFGQLGATVPQSGTVIAPRTIVVSLVAGTVVTVLAGFVPARRSTRVPPIAAVREGAQVPETQLARSLPALAVTVFAASLGAVTAGALVGSLSVGVRLTMLGLGTIGTLLGVTLLAKYLVRPLARLIGWPATRFGGSAGDLARRNAGRNPARTAATASALMIGVSLISFLAVLASGLSTSEGTAVHDQFRGGYVITSSGAGNGGDTNQPFTYPHGVDPATWPGVASASTVRSGSATVASASAVVSGIDPGTIAGQYSFHWAVGSDRTVRTLHSGQAIVRHDFATSHHLAAGDTFTMTVGHHGYAERVAGIYSPPAFDPLLGEVLIAQRSFDQAFAHPQNLYTLLTTTSTGGASLPSLRRQLAALPDLRVQSVSGFANSRSSGTRATLDLVYVLLGLAVVVSLFGMINTLVLTTFERTREIGMLRAVGFTRRQTRRMIRHEAVTTSLIGAMLGIGIGTLLAAIVTRAFAADGVAFSIPVNTIAAFLVIAIGAGVLSAVMPARRAARLDVLHALHYE
ncbi:MAG: ABC transporter permease [Gaiellales bacterium]